MVLRERAVTSARDAEVLLRWLQRPRVEERQLRVPNSIRLPSSRTSATMVAQMAALAKSCRLSGVSTVDVAAVETSASKSILEKRLLGLKVPMAILNERTSSRG